ncbi:four helix bundle protein [Fulvivirga sp. RKSG066]|uniref:four helix bundle protein n=1 Tax=Fulvivirga aurantia TaxID=2529383 RepID=UPI0012BBAFF4|nr:four helix bundle protein [Fulvivirga aurantia]MTI21915.1 four helix bundle protein [Fulvivirga aurantia]
MRKEELIERNKRFVVGVIDLIDQLPKTMSFSIFSRQLLRCASSVGANYRAACRAKSTADFINKLKIVEEEADESMYFLELIEYVDKGKNSEAIQSLIKEADELVAIYVTSIKTLKAKNLKSKI